MQVAIGDMAGNALGPGPHKKMIKKEKVKGTLP